MSEDPEASRRARLVERIAASTQITDTRILLAFAAVPRHEFLAESQRAVAYEDRALNLDDGQTVSQPSMIAIMLQELACEPTQRALEVGAGSGYAAAVLGRLVREVYGLEVRPALAERARRTLARVGIGNVQVLDGDGRRGLPEQAPFDRILVSAAASAVPEALVEQLAKGGRLAMPVGDSHGQTLVIAEKTQENEVIWTRTVPCVFVPLIGGSG